MELNDLFLIPIVDLCNHATESTVRLSPSGTENGILFERSLFDLIKHVKIFQFV